MKRTVLTSTLLAVAVGTAGLASAAPGKGAGAQKSGLAPTASSSVPSSNCSSANPTTAGKQTANGFAVLNAPGKPGSAAAGRKVVGEVALKSAPAGSYDVRLSTTAGSCGTSVGTLTVDQSGSANTAFSTPGGAGTYYVVLTQPSQFAPLFGPVQKFSTAPVTLR